MRCHVLLQGIFLTQGWILSLLCHLHFRSILYPLSCWGSPERLWLDINRLAYVCIGFLELVRLKQLVSLKQQKYILSQTLETRRLKSRCGKSHAPSEDSRDESILASSSLWWPPAILGSPRLIDANLLCLPPSSHGVLSVCMFVSKFSSSYKDTSHWVRVHPYLVWLHRNLIT